MTTPAHSSGEQPGDETVNAGNAGEQPQDQQNATSFDDYSSEALLAAITGEEIPEDDAQETAPTEAQDQPTEEEKETTPKSSNEDTEEEEGEEQPPEEPQGDEDGVKPPNRVSLRALPPEQQLETAQALEMVRNGQANDLPEAFALLRAERGEEGAEHQQKDEEKPQEKPEQQTSEVAGIEAEIRELRAQRTEAKKEFDSDLESELTEKIEDALGKLADAKIQAAFETRQRAEMQQSFDQQYQSAVVELESKYPDVLDENSTMSRWIEDKLTAAEARNAPELSDPRFILRIADEVAQVLGAKPAGEPAEKKPTAKIPDPPTPPRRGTAADVAPDHSSRARTTDEQARAMIEDADPDTLLQALAAAG